jgi:hypothetical protein
MKPGTILPAIVIALATADAGAQSGGDAIEKLRACFVLPQAEREECLDKLSHDIGAAPLPSSAHPMAPLGVPSGASSRASSGPPAETPSADAWVVSVTTSPVDYSPVAVATASSGSLQLSIQCRGGRTQLEVGGPALAGRIEDYVVAYSVNNSPPAVIAVGPSASGRGMTIKGDVLRLLTSLPDRGDVVFRVTLREGRTVEGRYALGSLKAVLARLAGPCKWPAGGVSRN